MSLPNFDTQGTLFGSMSSVAPSLFADNDRFRLFAQTVWPVLAGTRQTLKACYCTTNDRAGVEPVVLLGVLIFQYLERVPDRQAMELVKYHLGWKLALNLDLQHQGFHPTTLVYFRQRLQGTMTPGIVEDLFKLGALEFDQFLGEAVVAKPVLFTKPGEEIRVPGVLAGDDRGEN